MARTKLLPEQTLFSLTSTKRLVVGLREPEDLGLLKGAALLYPVVVFNTAGRPYESIVEFLSSDLATKDKEAIQKMCRPIHEARSDIPNVIGESQLREEVLKIPGANRRAITHRFAEIQTKLEDIGGYVFEDPLSEANPFIVLFLARRLQLPYYESATRAAALQALVPQLATRVDTEDPLEVGVGELSNLGWEAILELRRSRYINSFREFVFTRSPDKQVLQEEIRMGLWEVVGRVRPSTTASCVQRLGALVPTWSIPNPYAVVREVIGGVKEWHLYKKYGWLFFLQEARERAARQEGDDLQQRTAPGQSSSRSQRLRS